ncbi:hypothetical protein F2Q70_00043488 [Brassica cretica]|uniref:Uncharacterized protein n=1 Tax=Brassica cretica TaxID=69181 RepID=A0A8S9KEK0_BRACR|nr:hypothetical protein F2Q70_00043488 [Brassica cretica]
MQGSSESSNLRDSAKYVGFGRYGPSGHRLDSAAGLATCRNGPMGHRLGYGRRFGFGRRFGYGRRLAAAAGWLRPQVYLRPQGVSILYQSGVGQPVLSWLAVFRKWDLWVMIKKSRWSMSRAKDVLYDFSKDTECRLSDFSKGRLGRYQVGSLNKGNMLKVVCDGSRYVNHTYWKLNGSMKVQQGHMCGTCVVEVLVKRGTMDTQVGRKNVVNPLVSGVVVKAKSCSTIEVAFLVWRKVVGHIKMDKFYGSIVLLDKWFKEALGMDLLDQCRVNMIEQISG